MLTFPGRIWFAGLTILAVIEFAWIYVAGHRVLVSSIHQAALAAVGAFVIVVLVHLLLRAQRNGVPVIGTPASRRTIATFQTFFEGYLFIVLGWLSLRLLNHLTMMTSIPYADPWLLAMDRALMLDWNAYFAFVADRPWLIRLLDVVYTGLTPLSVLAFIGLFLLGRIEAARFFLVTFATTALICTLFGMFFPAVAAVGYALERPELLERFYTRPGWYSIPIIDALRNADSYTFDLLDLPGLTTFPSFHTAAGIVLAYAYRRTVFYGPVLAYTAVMIASTPIWGGHYFVDLFAGAFVAIAVCRAFERTERYRGLFAPNAARPAAAPVPVAGRTGPA
ncbi:MAG: phosphatase PAP2 family protein [Roseitalea porphyridii]|uniref:phosphatase PAP2 family protein n=1 Tax=Roseitalea porphyridii TaxID=1852022 RepID=UPI0032D91A1B